MRRPYRAWRLRRLGYRGAEVSRLPEFDQPPIVEMAIGVQFQPITGLRAFMLGGLRAKWRRDLPIVEEQPPLAPSIEHDVGQPPTLQIGFGAEGVPHRHWFVSEDRTELVQVQSDRLIVNWRQADSQTPYPRYAHMRELLKRRFDDFVHFCDQEALERVSITQAELNYINAVDTGNERSLGVAGLVRGWTGTPGHHLGDPQQTRIGLAFDVAGVGRPPVRLYVEANPALGPDGRPLTFLTFTGRGAPADDTLGAAKTFLDEMHEHIVRSFAEITAEDVQERWGRRQ